MKKLFLTMAAAAMCATSFAGTRILYQQNFETAADAAATGWSYGGTSMTVASDEYGKFLELALGQSNGRSGQCEWGQGVFLNADGESVLEDGTYNLKFDFSVKVMSNNQYNSEITIFTNHAPRTNETYRLPWTESAAGPWNNFLFDLSQCNTAADADMLATINAPLKSETTTTENEDGTTTETVTYSIDTTEQYTIATGNWYTVELAVDVNSREVAYNVYDLSGNELTNGTMTVPELDKNGEAISMYAEGMFVMTARYQTTIDIDNIVISYESSQDVANDPTVALTSIGKDAEDNLNLNLRTYTITFLDGETLHVTGTDGQNVEVEWADCDGAYAYTTSTSGTLKAWTTCGTATSQVVETVVECVPCVLPTATATISAVEAGFGKSYTLSVSNSEVPLQPTIFIDYEFVGKSGAKIAEEGVASGYVVKVDEEGTLTLKTAAFGYQGASVDVINDIEFAVKKKYDFARMSKEELAAAGFTTWNVLNSSSTSGFNNWSARKRLYYYDANQPTGEVDDAGNPTYATVYPFGFVSEDNTENVIEYSEIATEDNAAGETHFAGLDVYAGHNLCAMYRIGVYNNETSGGNNKNIDVLNLDETDFVLINKINNYGGNSNHPVVASADEYYAQLAGDNEVYSASANGVLNEETGKYTISCPVYRIDTAATCLTIFQQIGGGGSVEGVEAAVEGDGYYYTIDGIRLAEPNRPGLYIHNGKKIIVK